MRKSNSCPSLTSLASSQSSIHPVTYQVHKQKPILKTIAALPINVESLFLDVYSNTSLNHGYGMGNNNIEVISNISDSYTDSESDADVSEAELLVNEKRQKVADLLKYYMVFSAPVHQVGMCMLENAKIGDSLASVSVSSLSDDEVSLGACLASPCEAEELRPPMEFQPLNRNLFILSNEERIIKRVIKLRRWRRRGKNAV